jgi:hypothetical protein
VLQIHFVLEVAIRPTESPAKMAFRTLDAFASADVFVVELERLCR